MSNIVTIFDLSSPPLHSLSFSMLVFQATLLTQDYL